MHRQDGVFDPNYWGTSIDWNTSGTGWAMIVDNTGKIVDFVVWGYSPESLTPRRASESLWGWD